MGRPQNKPLYAYKGIAWDFEFELSDAPNLLAADIWLYVKQFAGSTTNVIEKSIALEKSPDLDTGKFVISLDPEDTEDLDVRTYQYRLVITIGEETYIPLNGDFILH